MDAKIEVGQRWRSKTNPSHRVKIAALMPRDKPGESLVEIRDKYQRAGNMIRQADLLAKWEPCDAT